MPKRFYQTHNRHSYLFHVLGKGLKHFKCPCNNTGFFSIHTTRYQAVLGILSFTLCFSKSFMSEEETAPKGKQKP